MGRNGIGWAWLGWLAGEGFVSTHDYLWLIWDNFDNAMKMIIEVSIAQNDLRWSMLKGEEEIEARFRRQESYAGGRRLKKRRSGRKDAMYLKSWQWNQPQHESEMGVEGVGWRGAKCTWLGSVGLAG